MGFADRFVRSLVSSDLRDDAHHHDLDAIAAAALAGDIGSLLSRVKYADGTINRLFEGNSQNLAQLLKLWKTVVAKKGQERRWVKDNTAWGLQAAMALYARVAECSLAHWLDGKCKPCGGTGKSHDLRVCTTCKGTARAAIECGGFERDRTLDMISELEDLVLSHNSRAAGRLRV